jgi:hypothetical protein
VTTLAKGRNSRETPPKLPTWLGMPVCKSMASNLVGGAGAMLGWHRAWLGGVE